MSELDDGVFGFAEDKEVDERGEWFAAVGHAAACDYQGVIFGSVGASDLQARKVENVEDVGITELGSETEADDIKIAQCRFRFEGKEGNLFLA